MSVAKRQSMEVFDLSHISNEIRYFYGSIEWPDLYCSYRPKRRNFRMWAAQCKCNKSTQKTQTHTHTQRQWGEMLKEKFVKIIVCGWIIYAECNLINYLWCVAIRPISRGISAMLSLSLLPSLPLHPFCSLFSHWKCWCHAHSNKKKKHPNQTGNFSAIDFHKCDMNGSYQKFSYQNKVHNFTFYYLRRFLLYNIDLYRCEDAWIADICLSAYYCLPKPSIYLTFQSKLLKQIKKFSNEHHEKGRIWWQRESREKNTSS